MHELTRLLIDLGSDPLRAAEFRASPGRFLAGSGLSSAEQAALRSGDAARIRAVLVQAVRRERASARPAPGPGMPPPRAPRRRHGRR